VKKSGEVGIIKLLDFMKHRGGVRIVMKAGSLALKDYREMYKNALGISNLLSVKQHEIFTATEKFYNDLSNERRKFYEYRLSVANRDKENLKDINGSLVLITDGYDADMMREVVNFGAEKTEKYSAVFSGEDKNGYSFVIASKSQDMNALRNEISQKLNGRGGGRDGMIQGKVATGKQTIIDFFKEV
jgi:alanyl-tRNA synthetase